MEPHEYERMFAMEDDYWWYRALRRRIFRALRAAGAWRSGHQSAGLDYPPAAASERRADRPLHCLDAGCGTGGMLAALGERARAFGVDASPIALGLARQRGLTRLACASIEALPLRQGTFDIVVCADVLYHRGVGDDVAGLREIARSLRPGGLLVLNLPAFHWLRSSHDEAIHTARRYTAREVRVKLAAAGLTPLQVRYWNAILFPPLAAVRLLRRWTRFTWRRAIASTAQGSKRETAQSDLVALPRWANATLDWLLACEARLSFIPAPAGLSVLATARRD